MQTRKRHLDLYSYIELDIDTSINYNTYVNGYIRKYYKHKRKVYNDNRISTTQRL